MSDSHSALDPVAVLAGEFAERYRRGERPSLTEYTDRYPELADQIRDLFPALVVMEELGSVAEPPTGPSGGTLPGQVPEQLGDYRILHEVGRGGMGIVYEAIQESLGRHVALKVLSFHGLLPAIHLERFRREARAAARLHHTNIVPVHGVGAHEGVHYYAMQFIQGQGLDEVLKEVKRLRGSKDACAAAGRTPGPERSRSLAQGLLSGQFARADASSPAGSSDVALAPSAAGTSSGTELTAQSEAQYFRSVAQMGVQVAAGLDYAHQQGILHRDIKPSNLLLDAHGTVWITDFGLAKSEGTDELTGTGDIVGTLRYMAPERFQGGADPRSDVYAMGITLYELLTLRPAFDDANRLRLIERVTHEDPPRPRKLDRSIPRDLETIVLKAIVKEPGRRYASAADLGEDLRRFHAGEPIAARPAGQLERGLKWARRRPALAALLAVSVLAAVSLLSGGGYFTASLAREVERAEGAEKQARDRAEDAVKEKHTAQEEKNTAQEQRDKALYQALRAENARHALQISLALTAWERHDVVEAERILGQIEGPFQQTWETRHLRSLCRRKLHMLLILKHTDRYVSTLRKTDTYFTSMAIGSNGQRIVSGSKDNLVKVWDAATGQELRSLPGHTGLISDVAISADGQTIVSVSRDQTVKVWDAATGQEKRTLKGHKAIVLCVAISADGKTIVSGADVNGAAGRRPGNGGPAEVKVWDAATGQELRTLPGHTGAVSSVAISADGRRIASGSLDQTVKVWDAATGQEVFALKGHTNGISNVLFSPDGKRLVSGSSDLTVKVWDAATGQELRTLPGHTRATTGLAFSADSRRIVSTNSSDGTVKVWDAETGKDQLTLEGPRARALSVAFSADDRRIVTVNSDGKVRVWDAAAEQAKLTLQGNTQGVLCVAISTDGRRIVSGSHDGKVRVWDAAAGQAKLTLQGHTLGVLGVAISTDGRRILSASWDGTLRVWDAATGQELRTLQVPWGARSSRSVAFSPDGKLIAAAGLGYSLVWDAATAEWVQPDRRGPDRVTRMVVWDAVTGQEKLTLQGQGFLNGVFSVAYSADGRRIASANGDRTVRVWDAATGQAELTLQGHTEPVFDVAFSADGRRIVSAGRDGTLRVWDAATGQELRTLSGHTGPVKSVAISADGRRIASGSRDGTVMVWDPETGLGKLTLKGHTSYVTSVAFSADGKHIVSGSHDGTVKVWEATTGIGAAP